MFQSPLDKMTNIVHLGKNLLITTFSSCEWWSILPVQYHSQIQKKKKIILDSVWKKNAAAECPVPQTISCMWHGI